MPATSSSSPSSTSGRNNRYADVWGDGDYAYVGSNFGTGVGIVDVSDPTSPALIAQVTSADGGFDSVHNVSLGAGLLYLADSKTPVVKVFDVGDPATPSFVRDIVTPDARWIHDVTVIGGRLFASGWEGFTYVYDVHAVATSPPVLFGEVALFVSWYQAGLVVLDISNPATPVLLASYDTFTVAEPGIFNGSWGVHPFLGLDRVLVSDLDRGLMIFDARAVASDGLPALSKPGAAALAVGLLLAGSLFRSRRTGGVAGCRPVG